MASPSLLSQARRRWATRLEVILKLTERCNIDCTYCYVFNGADDSYLRRPPLLSQAVLEDTARFLRQGCTELGIQALQIDFHGGEPLLIGKRRFDEYCSILRSEIGGVTDLSLALQTNAMLVDEEWLALFEKHQISPGVSLDGPPEQNDKYRIDFKGRGTYRRASRGLVRLREAFNSGRIPSLGVLAVIDTASDASSVYRHVVHDLGVKTLDFLFPDFTHDSIVTADDGSVGSFLCDVFDAWIQDDDPDVFVRVLASVLSLLIGGRSHMIGFGGEFPAAVSIASDGTLGPDDILRSCGPEHFYTGYTVATTTLADLLASQKFSDVFEAGTSVPRVCQECAWEAICRGGQLVHRFSRTAGFDNRSVYCTSLMRVYAHIARYLLETGEITLEELRVRLSAPALLAA